MQADDGLGYFGMVLPIAFGRFPFGSSCLLLVSIGFRFFWALLWGRSVWSFGVCLVSFGLCGLLLLRLFGASSKGTDGPSRHGSPEMSRRRYPADCGVLMKGGRDGYGSCLPVRKLFISTDLFVADGVCHASRLVGDNDIDATSVKKKKKREKQ